MAYLEFGCRATVIGSMPHIDPAEACAQITRYLKDVPAWPQLPKRAFRENMYAQFSEGFPGVVIEDDRIYVDRFQDLNKPLERLYSSYLEDDFDKYAISVEYAAGLHAFLALTDISPLAVKGQVTGPVTWGLTVNDKDHKAIIYDDMLGDAVAKMLKLKAAWQERALSEICKHTIIFVDEPYMQAYGSIGMSLSRERIIELLNEVLSGISGLTGIHCCGNTDWSIILETNTDIVSFDTYNYAQSLSIYPDEVKKFLDRNGTIAWGVVPNDEELLARETAASIKDRLEDAMAPFTRNGICFKQLIKQGLLTPDDGFGTIASEEAAGQGLELLAELSDRMRSQYL